MMQFSFLVALASVDKLNGMIPIVRSLLDPLLCRGRVMGDSVYLINRFREDKKEAIASMWRREVFTDPPNTYTSTSNDGRWDIWSVLTMGIDEDNDFSVEIPGDIQTSVRLFRCLRRARRSLNNRVGVKRTILGPWVPSVFETTVTWLAESVIFPDGVRRAPITWNGYDAECMMKLSYKPSDNDVDNDVEISSESLLSQLR